MDNNNFSEIKSLNALGEEEFLNHLNLSKCCKTKPQTLFKHPYTRSQSRLKKVSSKVESCFATEKEKTNKVNLPAKLSLFGNIKLCEQKDEQKFFHSKSKSSQFKIAVNEDNIVTIASGFCRLCRFAYSSRKERAAHFSSSNHVLLSEAKEGTDFELLKQESAIYQDMSFPAKCPTCGEAPLLRRDFLAHHRRHSGTSPYRCIRCGAFCYRRCDLLRHIRRHLGESHRLKCPECDSTFAQQSSLASHLISKHSRPDRRTRNFKCTECSKTFLTKHDVHRHMRTHTGLPAVRCHVCGRSFSSKHALEAHENQHSNETPFKCDVCLYAAKSRQLLSLHQRRHRGEKPFKCHLCPYASASTSGIKRHMNKHSGARPYKCPYCTYRSSNIENLRKHIKHTRKHKGLNVYPCRSCSFSCDSGSEYLQHLKQVHFPYMDEDTACATKLSGILTCDTQQKPPGGAVHSDNLQSNEPVPALLLTSVSDGPDDDSVEEEGGRPDPMRHEVVDGLDDELLGALMKIPNLQQVILAPGDGDAPVTLVIGAEHDSSTECALKHDQSPPHPPRKHDASIRYPA